MLDQFLYKITMSAITWLMNGIGLPSMHEGEFVGIIDMEPLRVIPECLGTRSMVSLTITAVILILSEWKRLKFLRSFFIVVTMPVVAIAMNIVRITGILIYSYNFPSTKNLFHDYFGYVTFIFGIVILFKISDWISKKK